MEQYGNPAERQFQMPASEENETYIAVLVLEQLPFEVKGFRCSELSALFIIRLHVLNDSDPHAIDFLFILEVCFVPDALDFCPLISKCVEDFPSLLPLQRAYLPCSLQNFQIKATQIFFGRVIDVYDLPVLLDISPISLRLQCRCPGYVRWTLYSVVYCCVCGLLGFC